MANVDDRVLRWHDAAAKAPFVPYEAGNEGARWAGGFAADGSHLEVITLVDGHEVSVDTARDDGVAVDVAVRLVVAELLWRHTLDRTEPIALPYSVTVARDDRTVEVDGTMHVVSGMRTEGDDGWVGLARFDDARVTIRTTSGAALRLRRCIDPASLPETPPEAG